MPNPYTLSSSGSFKLEYKYWKVSWIYLRLAIQKAIGNYWIIEFQRYVESRDPDSRFGRGCRIKNAPDGKFFDVAAITNIPIKIISIYKNVMALMAKCKFLREFQARIQILESELDILRYDWINLNVQLTC